MKLKSFRLRSTENKMNQRINRLKQRLNVNKYPLCVEKVRLITESLRKTEGEPEILRRAKALAHFLENRTVFIEDDEMIVGNLASKPMGVEMECMIMTWPQHEITGLKDEGYSISDEELKEFQEVNSYWLGRTMRAREAQLFDDERLWPYLQSGVTLPPWNKKDLIGQGIASSGWALSNFDLVIPDYSKVLNGGLEQLIAEAEEELRKTRFMSADSIKKAYFLRSVIIAHKGVINIANRFSHLASEMEKTEADPVRKKELRLIAETCSRVPAKPARTFYEAIQSFWFIFAAITSGTMPGGRFDQFMYPFYRRDLQENRITDEEVVELLQCLRIKDMQLNMTFAKAQREKWAGMAKWNNFVIGGVDEDGKDASNELSYLILEAAKSCPTPHHTITLRVHEGTPDSLMLKALQVVKTGIGMPAFVGDKSFIDYLIAQGVPLKMARDYALAGCIDCNIPGKSRIAAFPMFVIPRVFDIFIHNGVDPRTGEQLGPETGAFENFKSFDDLLDAFEKHLKHFMALAVEENFLIVKAQADLLPDPIVSSLMSDAISEGKDLFERTMPFENGMALNAVGMVNVIDSLAAIKKLVFDERFMSLLELKTALDQNWEGEKNARLRKACLAAPKYGNNDQYVDSIARDIYKFWADTTSSFDTIYGNKHKPCAISISTQWPGGAVTGATPDGRFAGECLADGTMSPMRGRDVHGPTAVINSAAAIDQTTYQSTLLNMKFHNSAMKSDEDLLKLSFLIKTYFELGGKHIQFNVVDKETLVKAQQEPENNRDLIVRVAGYSAYFIQLGKVIQDEVIGRTSHSF
jgi:pyruvate formate-lyase/glycerol dehydratase family glycyl radical enzyme